LRTTAAEADAAPAKTPVAGGAGEKLSVFISYSRDDLAFADQLVAALKLYGFDPTIDRHGISGGEAWQERLGALILEADTVVFVLSPSSARSEMCAWEVEEATRLGKRILPVLPHALGEAIAPARLGDRNYVMFYPEPRAPGSGFGAGLTSLITALETNLDWIRQHTRLLERAAEWDGGGRAVNRLLSGSDIAVAKAWASSRPKAAPEPTSLHLDYIRASEEEDASRADTERQRLEEKAEALRAKEQALKEKAEAQAARVWLRGAFFVMLSLASLGLGYLSYSNYEKSEFAEAARREAEAASRLAQQSQVLAEQKSDEAEKNLGLANEQTKLARLNLYEAEVNRARALVDRAEKLVEANKAQQAVVLTVEALDVDPARIDQRTFFIPGADRILGLTTLVRQFIGHADKTDIYAIAVAQDHHSFASGGSDKTVRIWNSLTGRVLHSVPLSETVTAIAYLSEGQRIVVAAGNTASVWRPASKPPSREFVLVGHTKLVTAAVASRDGTRIATTSEDGTIRLWDSASGSELKVIEFPKSVIAWSIAFLPDGKRIAAATSDGVRVVDIETGASLIHATHDKHATRLAVSPDGTWIVAATGGTSVRVIDASNGKLVRSLAHPEAVKFVAITVDGRVMTAFESLTSIGSKREYGVWLWDLNTDKATEIGSHFSTVRAMASLPDGKFLSASEIGDSPRVWLWSAEPKADRQQLLAVAKETAPSCLSVRDRLAFILGPRPKPWCLELRKPPYKDGKLEPFASAIRDYSDGALYNGDFTHALEAAELALELDPSSTWVEVNKAHALMFLKKTGDAREMYLKRRAETLRLPGKTLTWEEAVVQDFDVFDRKSLYDPLMTEIRAEFAKSAPPALAHGTKIADPPPRN